jgi:hypothetical protein
MMKRNMVLLCLTLLSMLLLLGGTDLGDVIEDVAKLTARPWVAAFVLTAVLFRSVFYCVIVLWGDVEPEPCEPASAKPDKQPIITSHL